MCRSTSGIGEAYEAQIHTQVLCVRGRCGAMFYTGIALILVRSSVFFFTLGETAVRCVVPCIAFGQAQVMGLLRLRYRRDS
jgi:hypothetical protein